MWKSVSCALLLLLLPGCKGQPVSPTASPPVAVPAADHFEGMRGCFLLYNVRSQAYEKVIGEENCRERLPACSTFKVPLAVMAFDSGALKDEKAILKWDGRKRDREELNQDQDAGTWMKYSVVWFSQRLTTEIGMMGLKKYLRDFDYGNQDMSGGLRNAWLIGPWQQKTALSLSAYEQVEFMKKLWSGALPAAPRAMRLAREITSLPPSPRGFALNGKTGSTSVDSKRTKQLGWFIVHLQREDQEYIAVTNFQDQEPAKGPDPGGQRAKKITFDILREQGLW